MVDSGRDNTGKVEESTERFKIWIEDLYMKGDAPYGSIYVELKESESEHPYLKSDVKISDQNISTLVNNIQKAEKLDDKKADKLSQQLLQLKYPAKQKAVKESTEADYEEEKEKLNVSQERVDEILEKGPLFEVIEQTNDVHLNDQVMKTVAWSSALSRPVNNDPLNLWALGESGEGKTHVFLTMFAAIPRERKIKFNSSSAKTLYYLTQEKGEDFLDGKVVLFNEVEASEEAQAVLRSITDTSEENAIHGTVKDQEYLELNISGNPVTWFTSVDPVKDGQLENRFMFGNPENADEHVREVLDQQTENIRHDREEPVKTADFPELKAVYRGIVENTKDRDVFIPFKWKWKAEDSLRVQKYFGNILRTIIRMNYKNRPRNDDYIIGTLDDYYTAKYIFSQLEDITMRQLKNKDIDLLEHIPDDEEEAVTKADLQEETGRGEGSVRYACQRLANSGLILQEKKGSHNAWHFWRNPNKRNPLVISLVQASLEEEAVREELKRVESLVIEELDYEGVGSVEERITHLTPSYMEMLTTSVLGGENASTPIAERSEDCIAGLTSDPKILDETEKDKEDGKDGYGKKASTKGKFIDAMQDLDADPRGPPVDYSVIKDHGYLKDFEEYKVEQVITQMLDDGELMETKPGKIQLTEDAPA